MNYVPKISVICPMYNAERYIKTCINSVLTQTFTDFELILIDDCSTDNTLEIAKSFKDSRIKLFHNKKNLGNPGIVRNIGLDIACGEFVYFIDNDDALTKNAFDILMKKMYETNADIIYSCSWMIPSDSEFTELIDGMPGIVQKTLSKPVSKKLSERILIELCQNGMSSTAWLYLYRRKLFDNPNGKIRFPNCLAEDVFVHLDMLLATDNIVKIKTPFYVYRNRKDSLSHSGKNIVQAIDSTFKLIAYAREKLTPLITDTIFIHSVCLSLLNNVSSTYLLPTFQKNVLLAFDEIEKYFSKNFSHDPANLSILLLAYLWGQDNTIKKEKLKKSLKKLLDKDL